MVSIISSPVSEPISCADCHHGGQSDIVGTTSAVTSLISKAVTLIQQIQKARARVKGASTTLNNVSTRLDAVSASLKLVQQEPRLQETSVEQQVKAIVETHKELKRFFDRLEAEQKKPALQQFAHALKDGDNDDIELAGILTRLADARGELIVRISAVHVGLTGNLNDGFTVARDVVMEINDNVRQVLGTQLVFAERLQNRQLIITCKVFRLLSLSSAHGILKDRTSPGTSSARGLEH